MGVMDTINVRMSISNAFKFSLLKTAARIASVRIFHPKPILKTEFQLRVLTFQISPNGIHEPVEVGEKTDFERKIGNPYYQNCVLCDGIILMDECFDGFEDPAKDTNKVDGDYMDGKNPHWGGSPSGPLL
ncbi:hypothetical protein Prudu_012944 [Prunus dulcis]|uniref:DUF7796 domain-containing protein n=1 Tax=Prunus dulcis TaxID=3755 RepID=A0A4Y1RDR7_PRUDU|nr:hypothetical protein Prudu_012944 [Prunus dulcis]